MRMSRPTRALALVLLFAFAAAAARVRAQAGQVHEGQYAQSDIIKGQSTYRAQCATCHGVFGNGVGGVDLRRGVFKTVRSDEDLMKVVSTGVGNGMIAKQSLWNLHLLWIGSEGAVYLTTVFDRETKGGKLRAVHTRHEYTDISLPGYTSRPEQYYGECEVKK